VRRTRSLLVCLSHQTLPKLVPETGSRRWASIGSLARSIATVFLVVLLGNYVSAQVNGYAYQRAVAINHSQVVSTDQANFPVLISGTFPDLATVANGGHVQNAQGYDIVFTSDSAGQNLLPFEQETYSATTGAINYWVQVPTVSHTTDTIIYMFYGNASITTDQSNKTGVWDANYKGVWHLSNGTILNSNDSTINANNGTSKGTVTPVSGQIDGAASTAGGTNNGIGMSNSITTDTSGFTYSFWVKSSGGGTAILRGEDGFGNGWSAYVLLNSNFQFAIVNSSPSQITLTSNSSVSQGTWYHVAAVWTPGSGMKLYINGVLDSSNTNTSTTLRSSTKGLQFFIANSTNSSFNGALDQLEISSVARSGSWIATEYNNQSSPSTFAVPCAAQTAGSQVTDCLLPPPPSSYSYNSAVTFAHAEVPNTDQQNFPVLISGTYADFANVTNGGKIQSPQGYDIVFTSDAAGQNRLDHEIDSYNPATGSVAFWVRIPTLSHTADTTIYMWYGNSAVLVSQENKPGVWSNGYAAVYHMGNGSTLSASDSTGNNPGTVNNVSGTSGIIGGGGSFSASSNITAIPASSVSAPFTIEEWANPSSTSGTLGLYGSRLPSEYGFDAKLLSGAVSEDIGNGSGWITTGVTSNFPFSANMWHLFANTVNASAYQVFADGQLIGSGTFSGSPLLLNSTHDVLLGETGHSSEGFSGAIDEARVSTVVRSADWFATEYNNQHSPGTFFTIAGETPAAATPQILSASPLVVTPGSQITITGANFGATQQSGDVVLNNTLGTVISWSDTQIVVAVPQGTSTGNLYVQQNGLNSNDVQFVWQLASHAPSISQLSVYQGTTGTSVTVSGNNFDSSAKATFNGAAATVTAWTSSSLTVTVPGNASTGYVVVSVTINGQQYSSNQVWFVVTWPTPVISLSPASGPTGSPVTISGSNFGPTQENNTVTFNGVLATVTSWNSTSISATVPSSATTGSVVVTVNGQASNTPTFTVLPPVPSISGVTPTGAAVGGIVTVNGTNFGSGAGSSVKFNGTTASPTNWTNTSITVPVPSGATTGNVVVTVSGESSNGVNFTVLSGTAPQITGLSATSATIGTAITINGSNFGSSGTVTFNGTVASPTSWNSTSIQVPVPAGATNGAIVVKVNSVSSNGLTFSVVPQISGISPTSGPTTSVVQINGTGFGTTVGSSTVTLNGAGCVPTSWSSTKIITELPPSGSGTGPFIVTVGGIASNSVTFTVQYVGSISGLVTNGATGAAINGAGIAAYQKGSLISSTTTNSTGNYSFGNLSNGTYTLIFSATGFASQTVENVSVQQGTTVNVNATLGAPSVTQLSPSSGPVGIPVIISGSGFGTTATNGTVSFNGVAAVVNRWSNTSIGVVVPSGASTGPVVVIVAGVASNGVTFTVGTGTVSGNVTAANGGAAISGATVQAIQSGTVVSSTTSGANGSYSIANLSSGSYDIEATASTYGSLISSGNSVVAGNITTVNLALPGSGGIGGTVTQSDGATPISGATVGAYQGADLAGTATTNGSGVYSIAGLGPGTYRETITANGFNSKNVTGVSVSVGNTTTENVSLAGQSVISYQYDAAGRLAAVLNGSTNTATYNYDAAGNILSIGQNPTSQTTISAFTPNSGPVGATVTIYGTGFSTTASQNSVSFNGTTAAITSSTSTQILVSVPNGSLSGAITVTSPGGTATSSSNFTVTSSSGLPTIASFSPTIGTVSTPVTITGTNYSSTARNNTTSFNGNFSVVASASSTTLATKVPTNGTSGRITVTNGVGSGVSGADFFVPPSPFTPSSVVFTGRMTLGGTSNVGINVANDIGLMLFDASAGQKASFNFTNSTFSHFYITIIAPGGQTLASGNTTSASMYLEVPSLLPVSGTYTVMVQGSSTGSLTINSYAVPANVVQSIAIGGAAVNVMTGTPGQNIDLTFQGSVGQQATLYLSGITYSGCNSLNITIFNPDGTTLSTGSACNSSTLYVDMPTFALAGMYTILIDPQGSTTGKLTASLYNATSASASISEGGAPVTVTIAQPGQQANISFSGNQGDRVSLVMSNVTVSSSNVYIQNTAPLHAGQKYNIEMDFYQNGGGSMAQLWYSSNSTPKQVIPTNQLYTPDGSTNGLQGDYFTDYWLQGYPQVRRIDPNVNFSWGGNSPASGISGSYFGAKWTGSVVPQYSENYTFCTITDDGVRLYLNGALLINQWSPQNQVQYCSNYLGSASVGTSGGYIGVITLPATGTYNILVAPQNNSTGHMTFTLYNVPADVGSTITPDGTPTTVTTTVPGQNANLTFSATAGQRLSLLLNNVTIANSNVAVQNTATLTAGQQYPIKMEYYQNGGGAIAQLEWFSNSTVKAPIPSTQLYTPGGTVGGLQGDYFADTTPEGYPRVRRTDPTVNFTNWNNEQPDPSIPGSLFSARWTGSVVPQYSENYTFCTITDDGVRLYFNSSLLINQWSPQNDVQYCGNNLAAYNGVGASGAFIDDFIVPVTGTYTIAVDPQNGSTGNMTLSLYAVPTDFASPITPGGSPVTVQTTTPGQNANLTFTGTAGQRVSLLVGSGSISSSNVSVLNTGAPFVAGQQIPIQMTYFQSGGGSLAQLRYYSNSTVKQTIPSGQLFPPNSGTAGGLQGSYFNNQSITGTPALVRTDPDINFSWNGAAPDPSITSGGSFSAQWLGSVGIQYNEVYTFCTTSDDGNQLWVNGSNVISAWRPQSAPEYCSGAWGNTTFGTSGGYIDTITLPASGTYTISIDPQGSTFGSTPYTLYNVPADVSGSLTINGSAQNVTITTPGQNGSLTFSGTAGQLLTVHVSSNTINPVLVSLLNPDGTTATSTQSGSSSFNLSQKTLGTSGTYTVSVDPQGSVIGSVNIQVTSP
jgi:YD repeat-containing protein